MSWYIEDSDGTRKKISGTTISGGLKEIPVATDSIIGGISSSNEKGLLAVDSTTGKSKINDNVVMNEGGEIVLNGIGTQGQPHTIEFNNDDYPSSDIGYNGSESTLSAVTVNDAIDELDDKVNTNTTNISSNSTKITVIQNRISYYSSQNILDNWYLLNPINQQRITNYALAPVATHYFIDRWIGNSRNSNLAGDVTDEGFKVTCTDFTGVGNPPLFSQYFNQILEPGTYSASILCKDVVGQVNCLLEGSGSPWTDYFGIQLQSGFNTVTFKISENSFTRFAFHFTFRNNSSIIIQATKLERSDHQTLAHLENNVWTLNEIPKYTEQLLECQRYMINLCYVASNYGDLGVVGAYSKTRGLATIPLPVELYRKPSITFSGDFRMVAYNEIWQAGTAVTSMLLNQLSENSISIYCDNPSGNMVPGSVGHLVYTKLTTGYNALILDANT